VILAAVAMRNWSLFLEAVFPLNHGRLVPFVSFTHE